MPPKRFETPIKHGPGFMQGNEAAAEALFCAGVRFFGGYPITPASEIMYTVERRFRESGAVFLQAEDEIAAISAVIGASWGGAKAATATSGPGFSLMVENLGYAIITETPMVLIDVQRAGPATGQATRPSQSDIYQVRWGTQGDYELIVLYPWSVQELFDLTIRAVSLSERFRVPVIVLTEENVGHLRENITIPEEVEVYERDKEGDGPPFDTDEKRVGRMPSFGDGEALLVTGSTHDPWGWRKTQDPDAQERLIRHLVGKILNNRAEVDDWESYMLDDAETLIFSAGVSARASLAAAKQLRREGIRVGLIRARTLWPFPELGNVFSRFERIFVPEMNTGRLSEEVKKRHRGQVIGINKLNARAITPSEIVKCVLRSCR
ncbi:MAG: 2-oxoacid:acceptor oxidoreductase subunit alpha [candidate division WOR-3 bacterium]